MKKNTFLLLIILSTHLVGTTTEQNSQHLSDADIEKIIFNWARTSAQTWQQVAQRHFNPASIEQAIIKGLDTFCSSLDPHSSFWDTKAYQAMTETMSGEFCGIGVVIDNTRKSKDKFLLIIDTLPDGPADKAGLKAHDKIIDIDSKSLEGLSTEEITTLLKGPRNSTVRVKVLRENQQDLMEFTISRDLIKEQNSLSFYIKDHDIYYLALSIFAENSARQVERLLLKASKKSCRGLILDLRNNTGGLLTAAIDIAGLFLEKNSLVLITKDRNGKETERFYTKRKPVTMVAPPPIFILVNNYTASAAEILAGFLKAHSETPHKMSNSKPLIFLVGTTTFGKGSVQEVIPVSNGCALKLTTQLYYLPDDTTVQGTGITPDFIIERMLPATEHMQWLTKNYGHEKTLENYIKPHNTAQEAIKKEPVQDEHKKTSQQRLVERAQQLLAKDNQLRQTIALIDTLAAVQKRCPDVVRTRKDALAFLDNVFIGDMPLTAEGIEI